MTTWPDLPIWAGGLNMCHIIFVVLHIWGIWPLTIFSLLIFLGVEILCPSDSSVMYVLTPPPVLSPGKLSLILPHLSTLSDLAC